MGTTGLESVENASLRKSLARELPTLLAGTPGLDRSKRRLKLRIQDLCEIQVEVPETPDAAFQPGHQSKHKEGGNEISSESEEGISRFEFQLQTFLAPRDKILRTFRFLVRTRDEWTRSDWIG